MSSLRLALRAVADSVRGAVPGAMDLRPFRVDVVLVTWSGDRAGKGTATSTSVRALNAGTNPRVTELKAKDVVASGGFYEAGDMRIGPVTPEYAGGGTTTSVLNPAWVGPNREVYYLIRGPGLPDAGAWFQRKDDTTSKNFRYEVVVRRTAAAPNIPVPA